MPETSTVSQGNSPAPPAYRLRRAIRSNAQIAVFGAMKTRRGIEDALRVIAKARVEVSYLDSNHPVRREHSLDLITQAVQRGDQDFVTKLDQQALEVEQWQVGLFALDYRGYNALKEIVEMGDCEAIREAA